MVLDNPLEVNYRIIRPSREISYVRDAFHTIRDEAGEIQYYQGILTDITQQKETEIALQKSQEQLQLAIEYGGIGIWDWNYQTGVNYWNDIAYRLLGYEVGGVKPNAEAYLQVVHPEDYQRIKAIIAALLAERGEFNIEYRVIWPDDTIHWLSDRGRGIYNEKGNHYRIVGTSVEITQRKQDEEALKISEANLNNAQRIAHLGSWEFDLATEKITWSEEMFRIFGLNPQDGEPSYREFFQLIIPSDRDLLVEKINNLLATGTPYEIEHGIICPDGSIRYLLGQGEAVKNEQGETIKAVGTGIDITARKQIEMALEASERQLRQLTNAIPGAVYQYRIDREGKASFTFASKGWEEIYGISVEAIQENQENAWGVVHQEDMQPLIDSIERSRQELSLWQSEHRIITPTGRLKWINARAIPCCGADGSTIWHGVILDNTTRKLLEEELNRSQAFLESIYQGTDTPIFVMEVDGAGIPRYLDFNPACGTHAGINRELLKGKTFDDLTGFLEPDGIKRLNQLYGDCIQTGQLIQYEEKMLINGQENWWLARVTPLKNTARQVTHLVAMVLNITERKNLEIALSQLNEQLEARVQKRTQELALSEIRARVTFEQAAVGMVEADLRGCLIRINQKFCDIVGYSDRELIGRNFAEITHPDDLPEDLDHVRRLLSGEYSYFSLEKRYIRRDGSLIWANITVTLTYNLIGEPDYFIGVIQDISEKKQAEEALREANAELEDRVQQRTEQFLKAAEAAEAANRAKSTFLANMSHELRTPLNAILGFSQLLVREPSLTPTQQQHLQIINRSGEHLLALINNVLEMSKIEAGQLTLDAIDFDLYDLLNTLEQMFKLKALNKGLQLSFIKTTNVPQYLHTDSNKLRQILLNLLSNALKFTERGSVSLRVTVDHQNLIFAVVDTGIGIDPVEVKKIFNPFVQANNSRKLQEGTGLGLPISKQFASLLRGELTVSSTVGQGSIFDLQIPLVLADGQTLNTTTQKILNLSPESPNLRILIAEDQPNNRLLLVQLLESVGFITKEAIDGQEALELWSSWQPHLILMDLRMPVIDGYIATRTIRQRESQLSYTHSPCKIIAITANAFRRDREQVLAQGCDDFITKPFQETDLLQKIGNLLGIDYLYDNDLPTENEELILNAQILKAMPRDWLLSLQKFSCEADSDRLQELLSNLPPKQQFLGRSLRAKVDNFDFEEIWRLAQDALA